MGRAAENKVFAHKLAMSDDERENADQPQKRYKHGPKTIHCHGCDAWHVSEHLHHVRHSEKFKNQNIFKHGKYCFYICSKYCFRGQNIFEWSKTFSNAKRYFQREKIFWVRVFEILFFFATILIAPLSVGSMCGCCKIVYKNMPCAELAASQR